MCGICGIFSFGFESQNQQELIDKMTDTLRHRGPDAYGSWIDTEAGLAIGHRRLAIRDLSPTGLQPMVSSCQRFILVYNGEVYSHNEISNQLKQSGRSLKGTSDTEVILEACAEWGVKSTLEQLIGMYAFALYDKRKKELYLARDRLGIKPLYWGMVEKHFIFGSELKALIKLNDWTPKLNRDALSAFMRHNYIPAPYTIYENIYKLEPGCFLHVGMDASPKIERYWDLRRIVESGVRKPVDDSENDAINDLDALLQDAVQRRMVADVPIGTLLSGGIDSSLVTALMSEHSDRPINTFTIGFRESDFNEAPYARKIAKHLHTDHTELYVEPKHAIDLIDSLPYWYDEPFADSSQIPTALICELTRKHVTVVLSGDGGDELFAGYNRYDLGLRMWNNAKIAPFSLRRLAARLILALRMQSWDKLTRWILPYQRPPQLGSKLHKFARAILVDEPDEMYRQMLSHWPDPDAIVIGSHEPKGILWDPSVIETIPNFLDRMQFLDSVTYLPDDILTKLDRASMRVSLEARVPLLDHRVVEMAWQMPRTLKLRNGISKWALRQVLYRRVPPHLIERPKMGFGVPFDQWLRGPLRGWAESLLNENRLKRQGLFSPRPIRERWKLHLDGANWGYPLWNVLMAQSWLSANPGVTW